MIFSMLVLFVIRSSLQQVVSTMSPDEREKFDDGGPTTDVRVDPFKNRYHESYGLVVTTQCPPERVMLVQRRIPYCLQNALIRKMGTVNSHVARHHHHHHHPVRNPFQNDGFDRPHPRHEHDTRTDCIDGCSRTDDGFLRSIVSETLLACTRDPSLYDDEDFERYERKRVFEDQYDLPHGQMSAKTKRVLNDSRRVLCELNGPNGAGGDGESSDRVTTHERQTGGGGGNDISGLPTFTFLKKMAGFLTAFMEFEEETGHTFRFDLYTLLGSRAIQLGFFGLDGFEYKQTFYFVRVDKLEKLFRRRQCHYQFNVEAKNSPRRCCCCCSNHSGAPDENGDTTFVLDLESNKKRREKIFREIDKQTFLPRLLKIDEAISMLSHQQDELGKLDYKYRLVQFINEKEFLPKNTYSEEDGKIEAMVENSFFDFTKRVAPEVFKRSVRRIKWRDR